MDDCQLLDVKYLEKLVVHIKTHTDCLVVALNSFASQRGFALRGKAMVPSVMLECYSEVMLFLK